MKIFLLLVIATLLFGTADIEEYSSSVPDDASAIEYIIYYSFYVVTTVVGLWLIGFPGKIFK